MQADLDFLTWLDRRDAEALGRVFDALGGKLLLLAAHLAAKGMDAGDLVQATFVAAMTHGDQWDRQRPLWPWLAAILHNEVRMQLRRQRRRREVDVVPLETSSITVEDPRQAAASAEAFDAVLATIESLPLPYRQVLRLRLVHGLQPIEIAQSLEVPVGTVRAQLHRGLSQLRSTLPAGIGAAVAVLFVGDGDLLAQVRTRVLEHAVNAAPIATGEAIVAKPATAGIAAAHGKTLALIGAGLLLVSLLVTFAVPLAIAKEPAPRASSTRHATPQQAASETARPEPRQPNQRESLPTPPTSTWSLTVHVEDGANAPIAGARVRVWTAPGGSSFQNREGGFFLREDLAEGATDANGDWRDALAALWQRPELWRRTTSLWIAANTPDAASVPQLLDLRDARLAEPKTLKLQLQVSAGIAGRIVDRDGTPIARATIGSQIRGRDDLQLVVRSDGDGRFLLPCAGGPEAWPMRIVVSAVEQGSSSLNAPARSGSVVEIGDVRLQPAGSVRGRLVLGDGSPIAGYEVSLQQIDPSLGTDPTEVRQWLTGHQNQNPAMDLAADHVWLRSARTNTRTDGTFEFATVDPDATFLLDVFGVQPVGAIVRAGAPEVELRVEQQLVTIECVDEHGSPLPGASIHLDGYDPAGTSPSWRTRPGFPATGQFCGNWLPCGDDDGRRIHLTPFGFVWCLYCVDENLAPVAERHDALPGTYRATCRIELHADAHHGKLHVVAVDETGAPVPFSILLTQVDRSLSSQHRCTELAAEGYTWDLPTGVWHVEGALGRELLYRNGDIVFTRGEQQHDVRIDPDQTTELRLAAPTAGRIAFEPFGAMPQGEAWTSLRIEEAGQTVPCVTVDSTTPAAGAPRRGAGPMQLLTRTAFAPGNHTFLLTADGCQPSKCTVKVAADAITTVRVEMFVR